MIVNSSKRGNYVLFDWKVNQDVTIRHLRYYPAKDYMVTPGRKGWGPGWIFDFTISDHLKQESDGYARNVGPRIQRQAFQRTTGLHP